jgi:hypothetical protein
LIRKFFEVQLDLRALASLRIALGALVFVDVLLRLRDLSTFYTDQGVLPRATLLQIPHPTYLNFYLTVGSSLGVLLWMLLLAASAFGLMVGWNTRTCAVLTWLLHIALKHRNPLILDAGDLELGLVLWWSIFLPLGARYSLDARTNPKWSELPNAYSSLATTGYMLQISLVYAVAALHKTDPVWIENGMALYYCFSYDQFATELGRTLAQHPESLKPFTFLALGVEVAIPLLLWMPWKRRSFQNLACSLLVSLHLVIAATLHLGLMVPINIFVTVGLWPGFLFAKATWKPQWHLPKSIERDEPQAYSLARPTQALILITCLYIVHLNYAVYNKVIVPKPIKLFGYLTRQQQDWQLFAPHPGTDDGWFVAKGECLDGNEIDLLREGRPVDLSKPESVASLFPNQRWRMWLFNLANRRDPLVNEAFARWLACDWNDRHPGPTSVKHVEVVFVAEPTPLPGQPLVVSPITLFEFTCPESLYRKPHQVFAPLTPPKLKD